MRMALANFPEHMCNRTPSENDTFHPTISDATFPVIIDSGASVCYTNDLSDFTSEVKSVKPMDIQGIASNLTATATGNLTWLVEDSNGIQTKIETQALYVPGLPIRLLSPQHLGYNYGHETDIFTVRARTSTLKWNSTEKIIHHDKSTNLPILHATNELSNRQLKATMCAFTASTALPTLTSFQQTLLEEHNRLGHVPMEIIQAITPVSNIFPQGSKTCPIPMCISCTYGKQHRRNYMKSNAGQITKENSTPGDLVSVDQFESSLLGRYISTIGRSDRTPIRYCTLFRDNSSRMMFAHMQSNTNALQTLEGKSKFERFCKSHGVFVKKYRADNGVFASNAFVQDIKQNQQSISYSCTGAHFQNGVAERGIRVVTEWARTSLLHAGLLWDKVTPNLWPYAVLYCIDVWNNTPSRSNPAPVEVFSDTTKADRSHFHPFGCPVYILNRNLSEGTSIPRWNSRSSQGIYLGRSPNHATTVSLVLNLATGHISAKYHLLFDDKFETIRQQDSGKPKTTWNKLYFKQILANNIEQPKQSMPSFNETQSDEERTETKTKSGRISKPPSRLTYAYYSETLSDMDHSDDTKASSQKDPGLKAFISSLEEHAIVSDDPAYKQLFKTSVSDNSFDPYALAGKYSKDIPSPRDALSGEFRQQFLDAEDAELQQLQDLNTWSIVPRSNVKDEDAILKATWAYRIKRLPTGEIRKFKARFCARGDLQKQGINFTDTYSPVISWSTVRLCFILAEKYNLISHQCDYANAFCQSPINDDLYMDIPPRFEVDDTLKRIRRKPKDAGKRTTHAKIKRKRRGKRKGRYIPSKANRYLLKLNMSLYGLRQAGRNWFLYLRDYLLEIGFAQSSIEPCLFYSDKIVILVYTDDTIFIATDQQTLDSTLKLLREKFNLTDENDFKTFLGIHLDKTIDGHLHLTQPNLITKVINLTGLTNGKHVPTPATTILTKDEHGLQRETTWNYRQVVGILNYIASNTRPDITFAVHQVARFCNDPKLSHEKAIKRIVRYLIGTRDKGITVNPTDNHFLQCYVDADFCGLWTKDTADDPSSVRSRTGYVLMFCGIPLLWVSKLQTEVALSTVEAEYIALSQSMRDLIPTRQLLLDLSEIFQLVPQDKMKSISTVFEDNTGATELARCPKMRPRTKHIAIKYHHFRDHVANGNVQVENISTHDQIADIFTKPLTEAKFAHLRKFLIGW